MLRMAPFEVHLPRTAAEAVELRCSLPGAMYVAGGTDLLPNLKHRLHAPKHLVSLSHVAELVGIEGDGGDLVIGAGTSLHAVATSDVVAGALPALAQATASIAGPQHRRMGTLGGNVLLDTRCLYYNQSEPWREALGYCLKKDGDWCHVIGSGRTCVAAQSSDAVPVLLAAGASLVVLDERGEREVALADLYNQDGRYERNRNLDERTLLRAIRVPPQPPGHRSVYRKVRARGAVDFPQLGVAALAAFDDGVCTALSVVVGAVMPRPRTLKRMDAAVGTRLEDGVVDTLAHEAFKQVKPQTTIHGDPAWRRHMARVELRRALLELRQPS